MNLSGKDLFAKSESTDMYSSIDLLIDKLDSQLIKYKEKMKDHSGPSDKQFLSKDSLKSNSDSESEG